MYLLTSFSTFSFYVWLEIIFDYLNIVCDAVKCFDAVTGFDADLKTIFLNGTKTPSLFISEVKLCLSLTPIS